MTTPHPHTAPPHPNPANQTAPASPSSQSSPGQRAAPSPKTDMQHHYQLYQHCHSIFRQSMNNGTLLAPDYFYQLTHKQPMIYQYPGDYDELIEVSGLSLERLDKLGWIQPIFNDVFVIWFKEKTNVAQLIPIDAATGKIKKTIPVNMDMPFAMRFMLKRKKDILTLAVVESPLHAVVLNDMGINAVATGGKTLRVSQSQNLTQMNSELIFISPKKTGMDAGTDFVFKVDKSNENSVVLINDWESLLAEEDVQSWIWNNRIIGYEFVAERIITKKRKVEGLSREHELILAKQQLGVAHRAEFAQYVHNKGFPCTHETGLASLFLGELLLSGVTEADAKQIVANRYGLRFTINPAE